MQGALGYGSRHPMLQTTNSARCMYVGAGTLVSKRTLGYRIVVDPLLYYCSEGVCSDRESKSLMC